MDARFLIAFGFTCLSFSLFYMAHHLYQGMDFRTAMWMRIYQSAGMAFLFVPINTFAFAGLPMEKNNNGSGIINLFRNMGGDIGISFVTTYTARRSQAHQTALVGHTSQLNAAWQSRIDGATNALVHGNPGQRLGGDGALRGRP